MAFDRFFYKNGIPFAFSPVQIAEGMANGLQELTEAEKQAIFNQTDFEPTPKSVTKAQGKAALIRAGLWQGVVDFVDSISDPVEKAVADVALNDTSHWQRSSPFLNSAAQALGLNDEQLDDLFLQASKIEL